MTDWTDREKLAIGALIELRNRELARNKLLAFTQYTYGPAYRAAPFHAMVCDLYDQILDGSIDRLMLFAPPQHGKSELTSVRLPALSLGRNPDDPVAILSYGSSLAEEKSKEVRSIINGDEFKILFPGIALAPDTRAADHWGLDGRRGGVKASGVGGVLTGFGFRRIIIDDPVKDYADSVSETIQRSTAAWYNSTVYPRQREGCAIVLTNTRWHENDLSGHILSTTQDPWTIVRLPALAETQEERDEANALLGLPAGLPDPLGRAPGESLAPALFSAKTLEQRRAHFIATGSILSWLAQYQGTPRAADGTMLSRAWFPIVDAQPAIASRVRYWDKAGTLNGGKLTAGCRMSRTANGLYYIEDFVTGQWDAANREPVIYQTAETDGKAVAVWTEQEPGSGGKESAEATIRMLAGWNVNADKVTGAKELRAEPLAAQAKAGNVRLVRGPWNKPFLDQVASFPNGAFKDMIDAASGAFNKLAVVRPYSSAVGGQRVPVEQYKQVQPAALGLRR